MKLNYRINSKGKKEYTLEKESHESSEKEEIKPAHYKFVKIRDAPKSDGKFFKRR